jgi:hypothetical protein
MRKQAVVAEKKKKNSSAFYLTLSHARVAPLQVLGFLFTACPFLRMYTTLMLFYFKFYEINQRNQKSKDSVDCIIKQLYLLIMLLGYYY